MATEGDIEKNSGDHEEGNKINGFDAEIKNILKKSLEAGDQTAAKTVDFQAENKPEEAAGKIEGQKRMLSREEKNDMTFEFKKESGMINERLSELGRNIERLMVGEKNSDDYVKILERDTESAINEAKVLIAKLNILKVKLNNIDTQKF